MPKYYSPSGQSFVSETELSPEDLDGLFKSTAGNNTPTPKTNAPPEEGYLGRIKKSVDSFIGSRLGQLSGKDPGILNPNPNENYLMNKSALPDIEATPDEGVLHKIGRVGYNFVKNTVASPLGALGFAEGANPPTEPIGMGGILKDITDREAAKEATTKAGVAALESKYKPPTRLELPPANPDLSGKYPQSILPPKPTTFVGGPSGAGGEVLPVSPKPNIAPLPADVISSPNPADAAKIAGINTGGTPSTSGLGPVADLTNLAEQKRLAALKYTAAEQYPGSRMTLPDKPVMDTPTQAGDTRLGFNSTSSKLGQYPLNVVPERLQPRTVQSATANLAPDSMKVGPIPESGDLSFTSGGKEIEGDIPNPAKPDSYIGDPDAEYQLPSAEPSSRAQIKPTTKPTTGGDTPITGKAKSIVDETSKVDNQDLTNVVQQEVQNPTFLDRFNKTLGKQGYDKVGTTVETQLNNLSPDLGMTARRAQIDGDALSGQLKNAYHKVVDGLSDDEWNSVQSILDGKVEKGASFPKPITDAATKIRGLLDSVSMQARDVGLGMKTAEGKIVPLAYRQDYFPHTYDPEVLAELKNDPTKVRDLLAKQGKAPAEIDNILSNAKQFGERMLNSQNAREAELPGYKTGKDVLDSYFHGISRRIEQARNFGPMDIADINSPAMQMVRASKDPTKAADLMKIITGRTPTPDKVLSQISDKVTSAEAALHLSTSALSHINAPQFIALQSSTKNFLKGLGYYVSNATKAGELAKDSGALENVRSALTGAPESFKLTDYFGLHKAQQIPRTWAAITGKLEATEAFNALKQNPDNQVVADRLRNLVLEDPTSLLTQDALTEKQINRASGRMAQLSQGLSDKLDKPPMWNGPVAKIMTQFHNYAMSQSANTWNAIKANPTRNIPLIAGTMLVSGELSGDAKSALKGLAKGMIDGKPIQDMQDEIANRGSWITVAKAHPAIQHLMENVMQSWALGIPLDMAKAAASGGNAVLGAIAGPTAQDTARAIDDTKALVQPMIKDVGNGVFNPTTLLHDANTRPIKMDALSKVPFVGSGFAAAVPKRINLRP